MSPLTTIALILAPLILLAPAAAQQPPTGVVAEGHDLRIDITWEPQPDAAGYHVYRQGPAGPASASAGAQSPVGQASVPAGATAAQTQPAFTRLTTRPQDYPVYSDFLGENDRETCYRVTAVDADGGEGPPSATVCARTVAMTDDELLTSVQKATFRYFWHFAHPVSGLAREGFKHPRDTCTSGGTGFGLLTIMVGAERGFVSRSEAAERLLKQVRFLHEATPRYHGAWSHWINGATGATIPFAGPKDNGGDIVETAFLVQGLLALTQYFDRDTPVERELRERIDALWREVDWNWYRGDPPQLRLRWHWSPDYAYVRNHAIGGSFNECMLVYLLGLASPTHPLPVECYYDGWIGAPKRPQDPPYANGNTYYGYRLAVGKPLGGPLFFTQYSFLGLDPRYVTDRYCNYFDNNRTISLINRAYCVANPKGFRGYGPDAWGLTASVTPGGYRAHEPTQDVGTLTPTAALSAMPYVPEESRAALVHFYRDLGRQLWGPLGFWDAYNPSQEWVADTFLAIDEGPIVPMIENHRTQLCWRMFMRHPDIVPGLQRAGLYAKTPATMPATPTADRPSP